MKRVIRAFSVTVFVLMLTVVALSCASIPSGTKAGITIAIADTASLKSAFGSTFMQNPFLVPNGLIRGIPDEFVVVRVDLNLGARSLVAIEGGIYSEAGANLAELLDKQSLGEYWFTWDPREEPDSRRRSKLERNALPGAHFQLSPGQHRYYLVFKGPNPIPRPATIRIQVSAEGLELVVFEDALPEKATKK